ncbi:MAG: hypothetical protein HC890_05120 [Chloroflexaceae bacterium]|nr:hypothetical protein [Chloroflexaceae bacterium]
METNRRLNELKRQMLRVQEQIKNLELDVEPGSHISRAFAALVRDIDDSRTESRRNYQQLFQQINQLSHQINQV